jgi:hypothetical protein
MLNFSYNAFFESIERFLYKLYNIWVIIQDFKTFKTAMIWSDIREGFRLYSANLIPNSAMLETFLIKIHLLFHDLTKMQGTSG